MAEAVPLKLEGISESLKAYFWRRVEVTDGCWEWQGSKRERGYGMAWDRDRQANLLAHRLSYVLNKGDLEAGEHALHECDNPPCVNPGHLFKGTQADNMADMDKKGRRVVGNALKTHCPKGHPYSERNTQRLPNGGRACRTCRREQMRARRAKTMQTDVQMEDESG